jgi:hypothetical protein
VEPARFFWEQVNGPMMTIRTLGTEIALDRVQYASDMMNLSVDTATFMSCWSSG